MNEVQGPFEGVISTSISCVDICISESLNRSLTPVSSCSHNLDSNSFFKSVGILNDGSAFHDMSKVKSG